MPVPSLNKKRAARKPPELRNLQGIRFTLRLATQEAPLGSPPRSQGFVAAQDGLSASQGLLFYQCPLAGLDAAIVAVHERRPPPSTQGAESPRAVRAGNLREANSAPLDSIGPPNEQLGGRNPCSTGRFRFGGRPYCAVASLRITSP